jgi:hypothetical protein
MPSGREFNWSNQLQLIHQDYAGATKKVAKAMAFVQQRQTSIMQVIIKSIQSRRARQTVG